jgi:hypothetical protein
MGFWSFLFGGGGKVVSKQLPSTMVAKELGEVNVKKGPKETEVTFTVLMEPVAAEGWQTGVAIDASGSMKSAFGKDVEPVPGRQVPQSVWAAYQRRGWLQLFEHQGQTFPILSDEAKDDLVQQRYFRWTQNTLEPVAREMTGYLAGNLDADGGTTVIYWACGEEGTRVEVVGDLTAEDCKTATFEGPAAHCFGGATILRPAVEYFADRFRDAPNGIYLFITDGALNDLEDVKRFTVELCRDIHAKRRNPIKSELIGLGDDIDEAQMEQLDDLDSGTPIDVWDHKIAKEMRSLVEIFAEVVSENTIVAPQARILDSRGAVVKDFPNGLPAKVAFTMPSASDAFVLDLGEDKIKQSVVIPR